jgi:phosphoglucosamine mutase
VTRTESTIPKLFGTDGVRGVAGRFPLDPPTVRRLGAALVRALPHGSRTPGFLVGRDTRESGTWIEQELTAGAESEGAAMTSAGVVPTPAIAYLTRAQGFDAGIVISASHNPFEDNGIKVFSGRGEKLTEAVERDVEACMADTSWTVTAGDSGAAKQTDLVGAYEDHLHRIIGDAIPLQSLVLGVDCANGATYEVAPAVFDRLGLRVIMMGDHPDGRNINLDCGSTRPERLARMVVDQGCHMGVAFDGDGDRAIFIDHTGKVVDGDAVLLMCARQLQREGRLTGNAIVATVMSNLGLEIALKSSGIGLERCAVGDKYVMEEMARRGLALGGEQSGHIIFSEYLSTGDGLCTALNVLRAVALSERTLADLASELTTYPQVLLNVRVREKVDLASVPAVAAVMSTVEAWLGDEGRLLVRYSGTEPLLRVMIEGKNIEQIRTRAEEIIDVVKQHLG